MKRITYKRKDLFLLLLIAFVTIFSLSFEVEAKVDYPHGLSEDQMAEMGFSTGNKEVTSKYDKGKYLGHFYFMIAPKNPGEDLGFEPVAIPLYKGDNLSKLIDNTLNDNPKYGGRRSTSLSNFEPYKVYLDGNEINNFEDLIVSEENVPKNSVLMIVPNSLGDTSIASREDLIRAIGKVNSYGLKQYYLEDADFKTKYETALEVLKNPQASIGQVNSATTAIDYEPKMDLAPKRPEYFSHYSGGTDIYEDFLMGNLYWTLRPGDEMELFALDIPKASYHLRQRKDLTFEPIIGADRVEIRKDSAKNTTVHGSSFSEITDEKSGSSYFLRGLKEGLVVLKVYYPEYVGRPNYIIIHVSDRESDYGINRIPMSSSLDQYNKYDVFYFTRDHPSESATFTVPASAEVSVFTGGHKINLTEESRQGANITYSGDIPIQQYWTPVVFTAKDGNDTTTKLYNFRSAYLKYSFTRDSGSSISPAEGALMNFKIEGFLQPIPKISRWYNFGSAPRFYLPMEGYGFIMCEGPEAGPFNKKFEMTEAGDFSLENSIVIGGGFGTSGFKEMPEGQRLPNETLEQDSISQAGGQNYPQVNSVFKGLPDLSFSVREYSGYKPKDYISIKPDKASYRPGEKVTLTIDIPDKVLDQLNNDHKIYITPRFDNGVDNSNNHNYTKQINTASIIMATNIPGLEHLMGLPPANNMVKGTDKFYRSDFYNLPEDDPIYHLEEKREKLEELKTLTFYLPEDLDPGTYTLIGNKLNIRYGPVWGMMGRSLLEGELGKATINVQGDKVLNPPTIKALRNKGSLGLYPGTGVVYGRPKMEVAIVGDSLAFDVEPLTKIDEIKIKDKDGNFITDGQLKDGIFQVRDIKLKEVNNYFIIEAIRGEQKTEYRLKVQQGPQEAPDDPWWDEEIIEKVNVEFLVDNKLFTRKSVEAGQKVSQPGNPSKEGYRFVGWEKDGKLWDFTAPVTSDMTLKAKFKKSTPEDPELEKYTVVFKVDGKERSVKVEEGNTVNKPLDPVKEGYNFVGWEKDGKLWDFTDPVTSDMTLKAKFKKSTPEDPELEKYTVVFKVDGKEYSVEVKKGNTINKPLDPVKEGYNFVGWEKNGKLWDFTDPVTSDMTLVAKFKGQDSEPTDYEVVIPGNIKVNKGSSQADLKSSLPESIYLTSSSGLTTVEVEWLTQGIDLDQTGEYIILGFYIEPQTGLRKSIEVKIIVEDLISGSEVIDDENSTTTSNKAKIVLPDDIEIEANKSWSLPSMVEIKFEDGSSRMKDVEWDLSNLDLSKAGTYTIKGQVEGRDEDIELKVKVKTGAYSAPGPNPSGIYHHFLDTEGHWAEEVIESAVNKGYFKGVSESYFAPNRKASRGEFITVLGRLALIDAEAYASPQAPDLEGKFYDNYANWALAEGILKGFEDGSFRGKQPLTREEAAVFLYNTLEYLDKVKPIQAPLKFKDEGQIASWAQASLDGATSMDLLHGRDTGSYDPKAALTRAEIAQIIVNTDRYLIQE